MINDGKRITVEGGGEISGTTGSKLKIHFAAAVATSMIYAEGGTELTVNNCRIENASKGVYYKVIDPESTGNLEITNSEFGDCYMGVNLEGVETFTPYLSSNTFTNCHFGIYSINNSEISVTGNIINSQFGIWLTNTGNGIITDNTITPKTAYNGAGVYMQSGMGNIRNNEINSFYNGIFLANSSPSIGKNVINNSGSYGVYCGVGSAPYMSTSMIAGNGEVVYYPVSGYNYISNSGANGINTAEIYVNNSNPNLDIGHNCIIDDRDVESLLIDGEYEKEPEEIRARMNYWGNGGQEPYVRFGIGVNYSDYLEACEGIEGGAEPDYLILRDNANREIDTIYSNGITASGISPVEQLEAEAEREYIEKNYTEAKSKYLWIVTNNGTEKVSRRSYLRLYEIDRIDGAGAEEINTRIVLFKGKESQTTDALLKKTINQIVSLYYVKKEDYQTAVVRFEGIAVSSISFEESLFAELDALTTEYLSNQSNGGLGKVKEGKYFVKPGEEYSDKAQEILSKKFSTFKTTKKEKQIPTSYTLSQNYPNPFNPNTTISYQIPVSVKVNIKIYDILGKEVETLIDREQEAGDYQVTFNGSKLSSGIYICRIIAGEFVKSMKMNLVK